MFEFVMRCDLSDLVFMDRDRHQLARWKKECPLGITSVSQQRKKKEAKNEYGIFKLHAGDPNTENNFRFQRPFITLFGLKYSVISSAVIGNGVSQIQPRMPQ